MVENALSYKVVVSSGLWVKLKANDGEALTLHEAILRVGFEGLRLVRQEFEVDWGIASVSNLKGLIDRLVWSTRWENHILLWVHLNHRDEWLGAWREGVANHSDVEANRWVNVLVQSILILGLLG